MLMDKPFSTSTVHVVPASASAVQETSSFRLVLLWSSYASYAVTVKQVLLSVASVIMSVCLCVSVRAKMKLKKCRTETDVHVIVNMCCGEMIKFE